MAASHLWPPHIYVLLFFPQDEYKSRFVCTGRDGGACRSEIHMDFTGHRCSPRVQQFGAVRLPAATKWVAIPADTKQG